jgi:hypothetical protein
MLQCSQKDNERGKKETIAARVKVGGGTIGSRGKMPIPFFIDTYKHIPRVYKQERTCRAWRGGRSKTRFRKIEWEIISRIPSFSNVAG